MDEETRKKFYPTSVLVTAPDIIFFWVARMIIAGLEFKPGKSERDEDNIPFRDVYFTGLIRDKQGRKMSKCLGNSPDPLELIGKYGADGLRFGSNADRSERAGHSLRRKTNRGRPKLCDESFGTSRAFDRCTAQVIPRLQ